MTFSEKYIFNLSMNNNKHKPCKLIMKTIAQIVFCNKNTNSANYSQTTHKMNEKYTECNRKNSENDLYELYKTYLHNINGLIH